MEKYLMDHFYCVVIYIVKNPDAEKYRKLFLSMAESMVEICKINSLIYSQERLLKSIDEMNSCGVVQIDLQDKFIKDIIADVNEMRFFNSHLEHPYIITFRDSMRKSIADISLEMSFAFNSNNPPVYDILESFDENFKTKIDKIQDTFETNMKYRNFDPFDSDLDEIAFNSLQTFVSFFEGFYIPIRETLIKHMKSAYGINSVKKSNDINAAVEKILCVKRTYDVDRAEKSDVRCIRNAIAHSRYSIKDRELTFKIENRNGKEIYEINIGTMEFLFWIGFLSWRHAVLFLMFQITDLHVINRMSANELPDLKEINS